MFKYWPVDIWSQPPFLNSIDGGLLNREMKGLADYHFKCGGSSTEPAGAGGRMIAWSWGIRLYRFCLVCLSDCSSIDWRNWGHFQIGFFGWLKSVLELIHPTNFYFWGLKARFDSSSFDNAILLQVFLSFWVMKYNFFFVRCIISQDRRYMLTFARLSIILMPAI